MFQAEEFVSRAILGIGDVYYHNADYNKAHDYFEKIVRKNPNDVNGQTGMLKTLVKMYESSNYQISDDPRLIIQQHSLIKHTYKIEKKLPLYILAKLARFYIDLPDKDDLRINYNTSPVDRVNNKALKSRAEELLNIIYNKTEKDIFGNKMSGKTFAEGYYQRGRYYRYVVKEYRMAMTQFEYAYKYDPDHFMALNDRAEILMELNDYDGAKKHLEIAEEKLADDLINRLGDRPEDETLLEADRGIVSFNLAKALYLSKVQNLDESHDWYRIQETDKFESADEYGKEALIGMLDMVDMYMDKAEIQGLRNESARTELAYYRGWINYIKNDYARALYFWQTVTPSWDKKIPNLELAKSYALYYLGTKNPSERKRFMETSLSHLYYLQSKYAPLAEKIVRPKETNKSHDIIFSKMAIIENNMGAIFEMSGQEDEALKHYQKSIHFSKKINKENEIATLNMRLAFKRKNLDVHEKIPLIMDFISPYLNENPL
jgi:tetratricopeptide (TPR) repeat protein